jgi:hypothetical protein
MPVFETYASRVAAAAKAGAPDIYIYDELPPFLREQISQIFGECIGKALSDWDPIEKKMRREIASYSVGYGASYVDCIYFLKSSDDIGGVLSLIEMCAELMADFAGSGGLKRGRSATHDPAEGLVELNQRFLRAGVGYQFENGQIIRVDSQYAHVEVFKEALRLLHEPGFAEANAEFMIAHRHLREGKLRDCNTAALRAMETVLKVICDGAMKAGVPKIRDRQGGHGAAPGDAPVPDYVAAFALHLTAANIVMLVKAHRSK